MSGRLGTSPIELLDNENVGVVVGIASLDQQNVDMTVGISFLSSLQAEV